MIISIGFVGSFGYVVNSGFFSEPSFEPSVDFDKYPDCELAIFSGDDGVCVQKNQIADLDWSSIENCKQTGKIIKCDPDVYPRFVSGHDITIVNVDILQGSSSLTQKENLSPKIINVVIGVNNTIRWNNLDDVAHSFVPDHQYDGFSEDIGILMPGESEEKTFEIPGVFYYHGAPGPWITGTIIVSEP